MVINYSFFHIFFCMSYQTPYQSTQVRIQAAAIKEKGHAPLECSKKRIKLFSKIAQSSSSKAQVVSDCFRHS